MAAKITKAQLIKELAAKGVRLPHGYSLVKRTAKKKVASAKKRTAKKRK